MCSYKAELFGKQFGGEYAYKVFSTLIILIFKWIFNLIKSFVSSQLFHNFSIFFMKLCPLKGQADEP